MNSLICTFSNYYREKFGEPVGKIPVDNGAGCPNSHESGCIFCLPRGYTPEYLNSSESVESQIRKGKERFIKNRFKLYFCYFQQGTCTAAPVSELVKQVETVLDDENCVGVIISTRPDSVPDELLDCLTEIIVGKKKECHFELGLQSSHDRSLELLNRNHTVNDFMDAVKRVKNRIVFKVGAHLIFGIPGETTEDMLASIRYACNCGIDTVKFHHLQVLHHTRLFEMYENSEFTLFDKQTYMDFLLQAIPLIPSHVIIHRLWAHSHPDLLVAPKWNVLPTVLSAELYERMKKMGIRQGCKTMKR